MRYIVSSSTPAFPYVGRKKYEQGRAVSWILLFAVLHCGAYGSTVGLLRPLSCQ